ncbi:uncharacterized protein [Porites lutea]|uniref:uncharacterized protein n=1 Tax=Porites lutea TaxID=51062 RepID=UPI003CC6D883
MATVAATSKVDCAQGKNGKNNPSSTAQGVGTGSAEMIDAEMRRRQMKLNRRAQRKRRKARMKAKRKEEEMAKKRAEVENQVCVMLASVQSDLNSLVEAEKRKSEQYLSLARKYYTMWKTLNDERACQQREAKAWSPEERDKLKCTSVTLNKRFSDYLSSSDGPFKVLGETLNVTSAI